MSTKNIVELLKGRSLNFRDDETKTIIKFFNHGQSILFLNFTNITDNQLYKYQPNFVKIHSQNIIQSIFLLNSSGEIEEDLLIHHLSLDYNISKNVQIKQIDHLQIYNTLLSRINNKLILRNITFVSRWFEIDIHVPHDFTYSYNRKNVSEICNLENFKTNFSNFNQEITYFNNIFPIISDIFNKMNNYGSFIRAVLTSSTIKNSYTFCRNVNFDKIYEIKDDEILDYINKLSSITKKIDFHKLAQKKNIAPLTIKGVKIYYVRKQSRLLAQIPFTSSPISLDNHNNLNTKFLMAFLISSNEINNILYKLENLFILTL